MTSTTLSVRLHSIERGAIDIRFFDLRMADGSDLPPFTAGAHVDVLVGNGTVRQYSISNPQHQRSRYVLGVKRERDGRGGSAWIHAHWQVGDVIRISPPRNNFPLREDATASLLLAGGIGITPLLAMAARLQATGKTWQLYYAVRSRSEAVPLSGLDPSRAHVHADADHQGVVLDIARLVSEACPGTHLYCCGPPPMLEAFERAARDRPREQIHIERFTADVSAAVEGGFFVELARAARRVFVPPGRTIVEALRDAGVDVETSCEQGICGACETRVLAGRPDHRDQLLSDDEKLSGHVMMICCSGSLDEVLVLDL